MPAIYDALIIGQGLAGSLLAWELIQSGLEVLVIDDGHKHGASSPAAAGIINPLAGKRLALYPNTPEIYQVVRQTYQSLEANFGFAFYHPVPLIRRFQNELEVERFMLRFKDPDYHPWLAPVLPPSEGAPFGSYQTPHSGWLDAPGLLKHIHDWLQHQNRILEAEVYYDDFKLTDDAVCWRHIQARRAIFCEGWRVHQNPWFGRLPWDPVCGDILVLNIPEHSNTHIINSGKWISPHTNGFFRAGSTYRRNISDFPHPSSSGREEILTDIQQLLPAHQPELIEHLSGVRPCTRTQHPLIGSHPQYPQLALFNGFGSKGAFLIPYHAKLLQKNLFLGLPLPKHVDIGEKWPS